MTKKTLRSRNRGKFLNLKNKERARAKSKPFTPQLREIESHPFYQNLMKYAIVPLWEKEKQAIKEKREPELDEEMTYHAHVAQYSISLFEALKRLNDIPYLMENNPNLTWMENKNIAPQEWFVYHYANYRVVATGILDTALLVVNDILQINLKPGDIHRKSYLERKELSENNIDSHLKRIDILLEKYREERNNYVHRSERPEIDFVENLNIYRFLKEAKEKGIYKGQLPKQTLAHAYFNEQRSLKAAEMRKDTVEIFEAVQEFLDILNELYLVNCQDFLRLST